MLFRFVASACYADATADVAQEKKPLLRILLVLLTASKRCALQIFCIAAMLAVVCWGGFKASSEYGFAGLKRAKAARVADASA